MDVIAIELHRLVVIGPDHQTVLGIDTLGVLHQTQVLLAPGDVGYIVYLYLANAIGIDVLPAQLIVVVREVHLLGMGFVATLGTLHEVLGLP